MTDKRASGIARLGNSRVHWYRSQIRNLHIHGDFFATAFGQNLLMSILFIRLLLDRKDLAGQSLYIGLAKMLGTFCASVMVFAYAPESHLTVFFAWAILCFDLVYIGLFIRQSRRLGINPLLRW